jgi:hypothetical protein
MSDNQEILNLVNQLLRLQLRQAEIQVQQSEVLQRLTQATEEDNTASTAPPATAPAPPATAPTEFAIGDWVRVVNPVRLQARIGRIIKIGPTYITILANNGTKVRRKPKNLILEH